MSYKSTYDVNDEWYTPKSAFESISEFIPKNKVVWEPFCLKKDIYSCKYLRELGFKVVSSDYDFFKENKGDVIITNPPFSKKTEVLKRLKEIDKPFIIILPVSALFTNYLRSIFQHKIRYLQVLLPRSKIEFYTPNKKNTRCSFYSCYLCYRMNIPKDKMFLNQ